MPNARFLNLDDLARARIMLGNPPLGLLQKHMPLWQAHAPAQCAAFAVALHEYLLHIPQPGFRSSSLEESDGYVCTPKAQPCSTDTFSSNGSTMAGARA